jgi:hypothetical protein
MKTLRAKPGACASLMVIVALAGCGGAKGPERTAVRGAILFDAKPLVAGTIRFIPTGDTKGPAAVGEVTNGLYEIPKSNGPVAGPHRVEIDGQIDTPFEIDDEQAFAKAHKDTRGKPLPPQPIPVSYNRQSTLTADVLTDGQTKFDFDLVARPSRQTTLKPVR